MLPYDLQFDILNPLDMKKKRICLIINSVKVLSEKKKHQLQILEYAGFSTFNIVTHICDIIKRITGNDERTKQCQVFYDDIKMTGNL